jgi:membrane protease subunit HflK
MPWNTPGDDQRANAPRPTPPRTPWLLEQLRRLQQAVSGFGGSGAGGQALRAALALVVLVGIWLATGFYQLDAGEQGLVQRFGRNLVLVGPGFGWRLPWPIETVTRVDVGHVGSVPLQPHLLSADASVVTITADLQYQITDPVRALDNLRAPDVALRAAAESALQLLVGHSTLSKILTGANRDALAASALTLTQNAIDSAGGGVHVLAINITDLQLPDNVIPAQRDVSKALEEQVRSTSEAQTYANDVLHRARADADRILQDAASVKSQALAAANADIARFEQLSVSYAQAPEVTRDHLYLETMQSIYARSNKVIIDGKGGANSMVYLPLDKLMNANAASAAAQGSGGSAASATGAPTAASSPAGASTRPPDEELRSREREDR